ncbi:MAG: S1 family peptidase [Pseudonocardiaceae bacterium]
MTYRSADLVSGTEPLLDLLAQCVVRIDRDGEFAGTGFFVAPGEVLTCAHVVHGGKPITVYTAEGVAYPAEPMTELLAPDDPRAEFYPQPDAAVLRVPGAPGDQACVRLEATDPALGTDTLQLTAFTKGEHAPEVIGRSGATLHLEALFEQDGCPLYKLREGQVIGGFSGGPLLNLRTGGVCAVIESTRSPAADLGGFGVPLAVVARIDLGLLGRNAQVHRSDGRWARACEDQDRVAAERAGHRELLPLLPPVVDLEWGPDVPPSELLRPRHAVVPFVPRGDLLEQVMRWREHDERLRVLVLTGAGGFGKTRTAVEICRAAQAAGWTAGPIDADVDGVAGLTELLTWSGRTGIAVDYAETRPELVTNLLKRLLRRRSAAPCRVVLVVRQGGSRQSLINLFATGDARDDLARLLRRAEFVGLGHGERELDRRELFTAASTAFAPMLAATPTTANLYADHFERPLFVLAAALLAVANPALDVAALSADELLGEILDQHETQYWQRADDRVGLGLHPDDQRRAVALAVLCGLSSDQDDERLVRLVPSLGDAPAERVVQVVRWLRELYGPHGGLEPDLLAEVLVARVITSSPVLIGAVLDAGSDT